MEKAGFALSLIGLGGLAEAYPNINKIIISLAIVGVGAMLMYLGVTNEKKNNERRASDRNVLDRLYFLR